MSNFFDLKAHNIFAEGTKQVGKYVEKYHEPKK